MKYLRYALWYIASVSADEWAPFGSAESAIKVRCRHSSTDCPVGYRLRLKAACSHWRQRDAIILYWKVSIPGVEKPGWNRSCQTVTAGLQILTTWSTKTPFAYRVSSENLNRALASLVANRLNPASGETSALARGRADQSGTQDGRPSTRVQAGSQAACRMPRSWL